MDQVQHLVIEFSGWFIAAVGGIGAIVVAASGFLAKWVADHAIEAKKSDLTKELERLKSELSREGEIQKARLRKEEILFSKEIDAATAFIRLHQEIKPRQDKPDMDWQDALSQAANDLDKTEDKLSLFLSEHGGVLRATVRRKIREAADSASTYKFDAAIGEPQLQDAAERAAGTILKSVEEIEEMLVSGIRDRELKSEPKLHVKTSR